MLLLDEQVNKFPYVTLTSYSAMAMRHNLALDAELQLHSRVLYCIEYGHAHSFFYTGTEHRWRGNQVTPVNQRTGVQSSGCVCLHHKTPGTNYANTLFCLEHTSEPHIIGHTNQTNKRAKPYHLGKHKTNIMCSNTKKLASVCDSLLPKLGVMRMVEPCD